MFVLYRCIRYSTSNTKGNEFTTLLLLYFKYLCIIDLIPCGLKK